MTMLLKTIRYKKTFWMNIVLSVFFLLGMFFFLFVNIDYVEARLSEKVFNVLLSLTPILTAISFYKNNTKLLFRMTFVLNIIVSIAIGLFLIKAFKHQSIDMIIFMLVWIVPFLINVIQLNKVRKS